MLVITYKRLAGSILKVLASICLVFALVACADKEMQVKLLAGVWEQVTEREDQQHRCVEFKDNGYALIHLYKPVTISDGGEVLDQPSIDRLDSEWEIREGGRLWLFSIPLGSRGTLDSDGNFPFGKPETFFIEHLDGDSLVYRLGVKKDAVQRTFQKVEHCSDRYDVSSAQHLIDASEVWIRGEGDVDSVDKAAD